MCCCLLAEDLSAAAGAIHVGQESVRALAALLFAGACSTLHMRGDGFA